MKQPKNETFLAAELAACGVPSGRAAMAAAELCRLGRRYFRLSELLCNQPDPSEKREKARKRCFKRMGKVLTGLEAMGFISAGASVALDDDGGGLGQVLDTATASGITNRTALR